MGGATLTSLFRVFLRPFSFFPFSSFMGMCLLASSLLEGPPSISFVASLLMFHPPHPCSFCFHLAQPHSLLSTESLLDLAWNRSCVIPAPSVCVSVCACVRACMHPTLSPSAPSLSGVCRVLQFPVFPRMLEHVLVPLPVSHISEQA